MMVLSILHTLSDRQFFYKSVYLKNIAIVENKYNIWRDFKGKTPVSNVIKYRNKYIYIINTIKYR